MKNISKNLPSIIFNVIECLMIFLIGISLNLKVEIIIIVFLIFAILRMKLGKALHYKKWYECFVWSTAIFLSLFSVAKINLEVSIMITMFSAYVLTKNADIDYKETEINSKGDVNDIFMWKGKSTKYDDIDNFIKYHPMDDNLINFENKLKAKDNLSYLIYKYRFIDKLTFSEISEKLDLDNPRIAEKLDNIAFSLRLYCGI